MVDEKLVLGAAPAPSVPDDPRSDAELLTGYWMSAPVRMVAPTTPVLEAYELMTQAGIRRLPVVDNGALAGIVTLGDLREARPLNAGSLSIYELNFLLARLAVQDVMTYNPFTVTPTTPIKDVAQIMLTYKVGGLPVIDAAGRPIGIITESDLFRLLIKRWDYFSR